LPTSFLLVHGRSPSETVTGRYKTDSDGERRITKGPETTGFLSLVRRRENQHRFLLLIAVGFLVITHLVYVDADSPAFLTEDIGVFIDEGFKTLDAKNIILYGRSKWTNEDEYSGWLRGSPVTVFSNFAAFKLFGVSLANARILGTGFALGVLLVLYGFSRATYGRNHAVLCVVLLAINHIFFFHGRTALFEVKALFFMVCTLYFMKKTRGNPVFFPMVILSCVAAYFCKKTGITFVLAVAVYYVMIARQGALLKRMLRPSVLVLLFIGTFGAAYFLEYQSDWFRDATLLGRDVRGPFTSLYAWATPIFFKKIPVLGWLALLYIGTTFTRVMIGKSYRNADILFSLWFLIGIVSHSFFDYRPLRYHVVFLVPIVVLGARGMLSLPEILEAAVQGRGKWAQRGILVLSTTWLTAFSAWALLSEVSVFRPVLGFLAGHVYWLAIGYGFLMLVICGFGYKRGANHVRRLQGRHAAICIALTVIIVATHLIPIGLWMGNPRYELQRFSEGLRSLGDDQIVVGQWAPQLCVDTKCRTLYSDFLLGGRGGKQRTMNLENLGRIRPDMIVFVEGVTDVYRKEFERLYPNVVQRPPVLEGGYGGHLVRVQELHFGP